MAFRNCCVEQNKPSGHSGHYEPFHPCSYATPRLVNFNSVDVPSNNGLPDDFSGPYKDFQPPGCRTPAVGEQEWGDVPYLPSYLDEAILKKEKASGLTDNLYNRGPFFKGVSETHQEYINRGGIEPRKYHKFVRSYEEPGMKYDKSITQTDFGPPYPMTARDKNPCLQVPPRESKYIHIRPRATNPHAKELESKCLDPQLVFIDEVPNRDFSTETGDNYICYQQTKVKNKLMNVKPPPNEKFQDYLRKSHSECTFDIPNHLIGASVRCGPSVGTHRNDRDPHGRTPWLSSKRQSSRNEFLILPSKCTCE